MKIIYKRYILWALAGLYVLAAGVQIYAGVMTCIARQSQFPKNFGNFESVLIDHFSDSASAGGWCHMLDP
ncbi:MAG: hypothetical protein EOM14_16180 [Clostridia bacterium]|nr:hypothetical protein [Clostridia bacterium]